MDKINTHTLSVIVDNKFGVLGRVVGMFTSRGYNIDSLTVAEVDENRNLSRITVMVTGTEMVIEQIKAQLERIVPVRKVVDLNEEGEFTTSNEGENLTLCAQAEFVDSIDNIG